MNLYFLPEEFPAQEFADQYELAEEIEKYLDKVGVLGDIIVGVDAMNRAFIEEISVIRTSSNDLLPASPFEHLLVFLRMHNYKYL